LIFGIKKEYKVLENSTKKRSKKTKLYYDTEYSQEIGYPGLKTNIRFPLSFMNQKCQLLLELEFATVEAGSNSFEYKFISNRPNRPRNQHNNLHEERLLDL
jgi:hypothetical protein